MVRATAATASNDALLHDVARILLGDADWVIIDRLEDPDLIVRVAAYTQSGPMQLPDGLGPAASRRSSAGSIGILPRVLQAPQRMLRLDRATLETFAAGGRSHQARQAELALTAGTSEMLVIALTSRDEVLGVLSLGRQTDGFGDIELSELADVAAHLGVVLSAGKLRSVQTAVATAMQTSLLPPLPAIAGLRLAARYSPAASGLDVGGDWYDAFETAAGLSVVIGDARGHDVAAAARMAELRSFLRAYAVEGDAPADVVGRLDRTAATLQLEAMATCIVGRLRAVPGEGWQFTWTNAGHLPPLLLRDGAAVLLETPPDLMLGVDPAAERHDHTHALVPGDELLLFTDGLIEAHGVPLSAGLDRLQEAAAKLADDRPDRLVELLLHEFAGTTSDDVALFALAVDPW